MKPILSIVMVVCGTTLLAFEFALYGQVSGDPTWPDLTGMGLCAAGVVLAFLPQIGKRQRTGLATAA